MATITTYLLVTGAEPEAVRSHELIEAYDFKERDAYEPSDQQLPAIKFALEQPLEETDDLEEKARELSADVSPAGVVMCEVEERFDQVERLQVVVFQEGKRGGGLEHGHFYNLGTE